MRELLESQSWQGGLLYPVATVDSPLLLDPILQSECCNLKGLPTNLAKVFLLSESKLLYVFGPLEELDRPRIHPFLPLRRCKCLVVIQEQLVLAEYHQALEEDIGCHFQIVVVVALHPFLDEVVVSVRRQDYPVATVSHPSQALLNAGVCLNYGAFLHAQYPFVCLKPFCINQLVQGLADGQVLPVAEHEGRDEVIFVHGVYGIAEDLAVIAIKQGQLLTTLTSTTDDKGLVQHASGAEIVGQQLRDDEIDNVVIVDSKDLRHFSQCLTLPVCIQLLLRDSQSQRLQLPSFRQYGSLEVVYVFH